MLWVAMPYGILAVAACITLGKKGSFITVPKCSASASNIPVDKRLGQGLRLLELRENTSFSRQSDLLLYKHLLFVY